MIVRCSTSSVACVDASQGVVGCSEVFLIPVLFILVSLDMPWKNLTYSGTPWEAVECFKGMLGIV